jgi:3-hydroxybutyrate dehydrogenase
MDECRGRVSVVTGAARGIGRACAEALAAGGASVALLDLDVAMASSAAAEVAATHGVKTRGYACDVRNASTVAAVIDAIAVEFGGIDHLVNNAGVQFVSPIGEFPIEKYDFVRAVDLDGVFYATRAVWRHLVARGGGRIVNIASVQGLLGSPYKAAYNAAKHGVVGLTRSISQEGAALGITVNAICPGAVMTDLVRNQAPQLAASFGGNLTDEEALERAFLTEMPTKRFIEPKEIGDLCAFLCSDLAKSINGAPIPIDGGWSAH